MKNDYITPAQRLLFTRPHVEKSDRHFKYFMVAAAVFFAVHMIRGIAQGAL